MAGQPKKRAEKQAKNMAKLQTIREQIDIEEERKRQEFVAFIKSQGGRPTIKTNEIINELCLRIAAGESLMSISRDERMPGLATIYRWIHDDDRFREAYARSRGDQGHSIYSEIQQVETLVESGLMDPNTARVLIDSKRWRAARMNQAYNDKLVIQQEGKVDLSIVWQDDTQPPDEGG